MPYIWGGVKNIRVALDSMDHLRLLEQLLPHCPSLVLVLF
jgi:hypothetical protein